jgi:hypothetical protein
LNFLRLLPVLTSFLLVAAHFFRSGQLIFVTLALCMPLLLLVRQSWVPWVIQVVLLLAAIEWLRTLIDIAQLRMHTGEPWMRMAVILGVVALFTAASGLALRSAALRAWFTPPTD